MRRLVKGSEVERLTSLVLPTSPSVFLWAVAFHAMEQSYLEAHSRTSPDAKPTDEAVLEAFWGAINELRKQDGI